VTEKKILVGSSMNGYTLRLVSAVYSLRGGFCYITNRKFHVFSYGKNPVWVKSFVGEETS
jgi:hypothetical protein